jgi:hypothetical protein
MIVKDQSIKKSLIYREEQSMYVAFGFSYKSRNQIIRYIWTERLGVLLFVAIILSSYYYIDSWFYLNSYYWMIVAGLSFAAIGLFIVSIDEGKHCCSATPIDIYENGIQMYSPHLQRLFGYDGFISNEEIESVIIRRRDRIVEVIPDGMSWRTVRWDDVPADFIIITKKGAKRHSGRKHPQKIAEMTEIMRTKWGIPILDRGVPVVSLKINESNNLP